MYGDHQCLHVLTHSFPTRLSSDLAGGDHAADAVVEQGPGGMLARRAAAEIVAGDQDLRALVLRLVHEEFRHRGAVRRLAQLEEQAFRQAGRSAERREGKEGVSTCRSGWSPSN